MEEHNNQEMANEQELTFQQTNEHIACRGSFLALIQLGEYVRYLEKSSERLDNQARTCGKCDDQFLYGLSELKSQSISMLEELKAFEHAVRRYVFVEREIRKHRLASQRNAGHDQSEPASAPALVSVDNGTAVAPSHQEEEDE